MNTDKFSPLVSVIMPVYNNSQYVEDAIQSVLRQSYRRIEFVIVNDGSTDDSEDKIMGFKDKRIVYVRKEHNYIESLNYGLDICHGKYIVRMDSDDIMANDRISIEVKFMETHSDIAVMGAWMTCIGEGDAHGRIIKGLKGEIKNPLIEMLRGNFIFNPTTIIRNSLLESVSIRYRHEYLYAEDYAFWCDLAKHHARFYIIDYPLHFYRISKEQTSRENHEKQYRAAELVRNGLREYLFDRSTIEMKSLIEAFVQALEKGLLSREMYNSYVADVFGFNKLLINI